MEPIVEKRKLVSILKKNNEAKDRIEIKNQNSKEKLISILTKIKKGKDKVFSTENKLLASDIKNETIKVNEECYVCGKLCAPKGLKAHLRSHINIKNHDCNVCGETFRTKKLLKRHKIIHRVYYLCEDCNKKYRDTDHLRRHKCKPIVHQKECQYCGKLCAPKGLLSHIRSHLNENKHNCTLCEETFSSKEKLSKHKQTHINYLKCEDCNRVFRDETYLKNHICIYGKVRRHICEYCNKGFFSNYDLKRHIRIHTNDKPYVCEFCNNRYNQKSGLTSHYRVHRKELMISAGIEEPVKEKAIKKKEKIKKVIKEKRFVCQICFQAFTYRHHLKRHNLTHTKEKPFVCDVCNKGFAQKAHLQLHAATHLKERPFECDECDKRYPCEYKLIQHKRRHLGRKFFCSYCDRKFYSISDYNRHVLTHTKAKPYICDVCHKGFTARWTLRHHYLIHANPAKTITSKKEVMSDEKKSVEENKIEDLNHLSISSEEIEEKPYACSVCKTIFPTETLLDWHINEFIQRGSFRCCMCGESFDSREDLLEHHIIHDVAVIEKPYISYL